MVLRPPGIWTEDTYHDIEALRADRPPYEWSPFWEYGAFLDARDLATAIEQSLLVDYPGARPLAHVRTWTGNAVARASAMTSFGLRIDVSANTSAPTTPS